jgi:hypothetical protein
VRAKCRTAGVKAGSSKHSSGSQPLGMGAWKKIILMSNSPKIIFVAVFSHLFRKHPTKFLIQLLKQEVLGRTNRLLSFDTTRTA